MKITIQDIANAANVAKSTVSKVINDSPKISGETKRKIREIMKEMNFTPSSIATRLAKQSSFNIGLLFDMSQDKDYLDPFFYNIMVGIESVIGPLKYEMTMANVHHNDPDRHFLKRLVLSRRIDGLIGNNANLTNEAAAKLEELRFPFVLMGEYDAFPVSWVDFDNAEGGRMLTGHLLEQGYRDIAFIGGEREERLFENRHRGYSDSLRAAGLPISAERTFHGIADDSHGYESVLSMLRSAPGERPDAIVCMSNQVAFGALRAAKEAGVQIPNELGIATFDDFPFSPHTSPPLTSLLIDTFKLGSAAADMLIERISYPELPRRNLLLQPELIVRESTARA
ncbi:LacI family DNA-binding transcriptional regulator [Cohnella faecalis]|uniref:LacI family transcriptional regulator n=1 Tax=Cohnella faecalis TaxID=2315694 RepID=A0A398CB24_9BACL|nr:LacI family DNA-binding transcriptional regulator [Cohnella faecalis]RIE00346.1 LacI family transcriptional regulator [Cohnella faecalis]